MKQTAIIIIVLIFSFKAYSQTERIAHRSHSGKDNTFKVTGYNNWGETPAMKAEREKRDSIMKAKADSVSKKMSKSTARKPRKAKSGKK